MNQKDKVLVICDVAAPMAPDQDFSADLKTEDWKTEGNVIEALQQLGLPYELLPIHDTTDVIREKIESWRPDVVFNLVEQFKNNSAFEQNFTSFLELQGVPFSGCGSTGITLCKHKGIAKKILSYHRIRVPEFTIFPPGRRIVRPRRLRFPIFIKPLKMEASYGIAQASFVENDDQLKQRVEFIHANFRQEALAEEYIAGREIYVSILGNHRLQVFPVREMVFQEVEPDEPKIATYKAKWDENYRKRWGIRNDFPPDLDHNLVQRLERMCKKVYQLLSIQGYARLDLRLTPQNEIVFIEANPNPILAKDEDFAESAAKGGLPYPKLIDRILALAKTAVRE